MMALCKAAGRIAARALCAALASLFLVAGARADEVVAFVTGVEGSARIERGAAARPLALLDAVARGARLALAGGARLTLAIPGEEGFVVEISGPGRFALQPGAVIALPGTDPASVVRRDLSPALRALRIDPRGAVRAGASMRGPSSAQGLTAPRGAILPEDAREFAWTQPSGTPGGPFDYEFRLIDDQGAVLARARVADPRIRPDPAPVINPGAAYVWTVEATGRGNARAALAVEFRVLSREDQQRVRAALAEDALPEPERVVRRIALHQMGFAGAPSEIIPHWQRDW